jgi:hypothetical protein
MMQEIAIALICCDNPDPQAQDACGSTANLLVHNERSAG